jgi:DNA-binding MurR/RpiR family transcriptional regulator
MSNPLLRLRETAKALSDTEQEIASHVLANPQVVVDMSIHDLAKYTFSSASTIVRLCHHVGYSGYRDFRKAVTYELTLREQNKRTEQKEIARTDTIEELIDKITYRNIISLEETKELLDTDTLRQCVDLIRKAHVIYLFGMGASLMVCKDAYLKFLRLNKLCVINEDWHAQLLQARNATEHDVAIVISYSGATVEVIECMKALKENHTPIIAITRCVTTPVSELADYKLYTSSSESIFRVGAISSRISQLNVIDILHTALANEQYEASLDQLSRTHIHKPGSPVGKGSTSAPTQQEEST